MKKTLIALSLVAAMPAFGTPTEEIRKLDPAWQTMEKKVSALLGQTNQRKLLDMAYAQVAADACPGLGLNNKAYDEAFTGMVSGHKKDAAEQRRFENTLMTDFGVYTGLVVAESFLDKPGFCQAVESIKAKHGGPSQFWTVK